MAGPDSKIVGWGDISTDPGSLIEAIEELSRINFQGGETNPDMVVGKINWLERTGKISPEEARTWKEKIGKLAKPSGR